MTANRTYIAIDLKSFYASVECVERGLDPLHTHLVVADESRTEKTICLAVTPSLKAYGVPGRARLFEAIQKVEDVNRQRRYRAPGRAFTGSSWDADELKKHPEWAVDFIKAPPRMGLYIEYSTRIYDIYLRHVAPEDIHVYSIDEVFMDVTGYLKTAKMTAREFASSIIQEVFTETGITAAAGVGTNLYLCKIAMDIEAKHIPPDRDGVRIAELTERGYREKLWGHRPLTDFWRVGRGTAGKLEGAGLFTMGDIARCSLRDEGLLYRPFGVNAELLIDHAWGWEPCTIADIRAYKPASNSVSAGQVLPCAYDFHKARLIVREMTDALSLDLLDKGLVTDQLVLTVGYDIGNLSDPGKRASFRGEITEDWYGRSVPKNAHGTENLGRCTSSSSLLTGAMLRLYDRIVDPALLVRRMYVVANRVTAEQALDTPETFEQMDLFTDYEDEERRRGEEASALSQERKRLEAVLAIKHKFGKNAIFRGTSLEEGATGLERNKQVGGHRA